MIQANELTKQLLKSGWKKRKGFTDIVLNTEKFEFRYIETTNQFLIWSKKNTVWECINDVTIERVKSIVFGLTSQELTIKDK